MEISIIKKRPSFTYKKELSLMIRPEMQISKFTFLWTIKAEPPRSSNKRQVLYY